MRRYEQVADLINTHHTPSDIMRKLKIGVSSFRNARLIACDKGLIDYQGQKAGRKPQHEPSPKITEDATASLAWAGVSFEDSAAAARPEGFCRLQAPVVRSWSSLSHV